MKRISKTLLLLSFLSWVNVQAQQWKPVSESALKQRGILPQISAATYKTVEVNVNDLLAKLQSVPHEKTAAKGNEGQIIDIPMPDGKLQHFTIKQYDIEAEAPSWKFPQIRTFRGQGIEDKTATISLDWTEFGFHAMILSDVSGSVWIDPYSRGNTSRYISYFKKDLSPKTFHEEGLIMPEINKQSLMKAATGGVCIGTQLRTYRLAVACTGEYAQAVGGTTAAKLHSAIVTTINRVNGVFEKEVAIRLVLAANNTAVEYMNAGTDPFTGNNDAGTLIYESQSVINSIIGTVNYDIGHTFSTGGGGLAGLGVVCLNNYKAMGITGSPNPTGDAYDIDYVAHEVGHQFGARHTFNAATGACGGNGSSTTNAEPGSGSTIMAYAGICGSSNDLQPNSDPQFHAVSFNEITTFTHSGAGSSCAVVSNTGNTAPVVNAGSNYTIPVSTPFMLTGSATDANGDALTYSWEQIDIGGTYGNWNTPSGDAPLFRSYQPTVSPTRVFPKMSAVLNGGISIGEILPSYIREMNFRLTVRDNRSGGGGVCFGNVRLTTAGTTPFTVTSQNSFTTWSANGSNTANITWNVAGTSAPPVNTTAVDILLSADGGQTFPYILASATANDGAETIIIPSVFTGQARIMVKAVGNVFFNVNAVNFSIVQGCTGMTCPSPIERNIRSGCSDSIALSVPVLSTCAVPRKLTWVLTGATTGQSDSTGINYLYAKRFKVGITTVSYYATDQAGNTTTCSYTVTIREAVKPVIFSPGNVTKYVTGSCNPVVYIPKPTYSDNCAVASLTWQITGATTGNSAMTGINFIGSRLFNNGNSTVTYTVTDRSGNSANISFNVTVDDTTRPVINFIPNYTEYTAMDRCDKVIAIPNPVISDPCGVSKVTWTMSGATIRSSASTGINYLGAQLFNAGITSVTYTVTDSYGNVASRLFLVRLRVSNPAYCGFSRANSSLLEEEKPIILSPNPTRNFFTVQMQNSQMNNATIEVIDATGKRVELINNYGTKPLKLGAGYSKGVYFILVKKDGYSTTLKAIKN